MSVGMIGAAVVGGYVANQAANKQARATRDAAQMGAAAADPFANQRGFYQQILRNVYGGMDSSGLNVTSPDGTTTTGSQYYETGGVRTAPGDTSRFITNPAYTQWHRLQREPESDPNIPAPPQYIANPAWVERQGSTSATSPGTTGGDTPFNPVLDFIQNSPDYQFRFNEGQRAIERSAASRGMFQSGNLLRDLTSFGQGQASQAYESEINRIMTMAGATTGSPGVAGQIASAGGANSAAIRAEGTNTALQQVGYGLAGAFNQFNQPTTANSGIAGQTGYQGGASGVLSGDEFASWG